MTDIIELVIKIPDDIYYFIKTHCRTENVLDMAIVNGIQIPKGHGDLIDRNDLLAKSYCIDDYAEFEADIVDTNTVEMAEAIIEADKSEREE